MSSLPAGMKREGPSCTSIFYRFWLLIWSFSIALKCVGSVGFKFVINLFMACMWVPRLLCLVYPCGPDFVHGVTCSQVVWSSMSQDCLYERGPPYLYVQGVTPWERCKTYQVVWSMSQIQLCQRGSPSMYIWGVTPREVFKTYLSPDMKPSNLQSKLVTIQTDID